MIIDPHHFTGKPLVPKTTAQDDYTISFDGLAAGRITLRPADFGASRWFWTVTGPAMVQADLPSSGETESLDQARAAFRMAFDRWLAWATTATIPLRRHGHEDPPARLAPMTRNEPRWTCSASQA